MTDFLPAGKLTVDDASYGEHRAQSPSEFQPPGQRDRGLAAANRLMDHRCANATSDVAQYSTWLPFLGFGPSWFGVTRSGRTGGESDVEM